MAHDILIVDDEADIRMLIAGVLKDEGYATREAADTPQTLAAIQARQPTLVILDIWLQGGGLEGIEILKQLRVEMPSVPVVMISGHGTIETAVEAIKIGAYDFLEKPFKSDRLLLIVERAIEAAQLRRENEELRLRAGGELDLVGGSPAANQLRLQIERVAPTGSRVLITGPPGSGKEVVGRLLHARSRRAKGPFVPVNCATMRPERLEIELFGTETRIDGAPRKVGTFERAHGGTLFLDEVADMPLETQGKIVRVLQEQTFERVGGSSRVEVDVRVVASSNRELGGEISAGRFREDLFYRLSVVPIRIPPLRDRREDIPILVKHFADLFSRENNRRPPEFTRDALQYLQKARWKGNVRELKNTVERLMIMAPGPKIDEDDLREVVRLETKPAGPDNEKERPGTLREFKESAERAFLVGKLRENNWNISKTAEVIGTPRSNLYKKLEQYGISQEVDG
jgi:two-component system, NtrC family, nitrogen regulation response regulator NtrX